MALSKEALERIEGLKSQLQDGSLRNSNNPSGTTTTKSSSSGGTATTTKTTSTTSTSSSSSLDSAALSRIEKLKAQLRDGSLRNSSNDKYYTYSKFGSEDESNYYTKYKSQSYDNIQKALSTLEDGDEKKWLSYYQYDLYKRDSNYNSKAISGLKSYEAQKVAEAEADQNKTWWERIAETFAYSSPDTSLPGAMINQQITNYRNDTSYREINDDWSEGQKRQFGYLYAEDPNKAYAYAEQINNQINAYKKYEMQQGVGADASENFGTGAIGTLGAIATAPTAITDLLDDFTEYAGRGTITQKEYLTPFEYGQAAQSGIANKLNAVDENGEAQNVLPDWVPIMGGKGWGDIYSLGVSTANSMLSALTLGGTGTLVNFIGQGGAAGVDDALSRGATAEQALLYGTAVGALEGLTEMIPAEKLIKVGPSSTMKNYLKQVLQQGVGELFEEGTSSLLGNLADDLIMRDKSNYSLMVKELMQKNPGMTEEEASKIAFKQMVNDVAFDAVGGFASGSVSAGMTGGYRTMMDARKGSQKNIDAVKQYGEHTDALIQEGLESDKNSDSYKLAEKYQKQVKGEDGKDGKAMTGFQIRNLLAANQEQITPKDLKLVQAAAEKRLTELGQTEDVAKVAELATKYATGQKLSKSDKSFLARSEYGSRVANELLPKNIESGDYSTDWAEDIGTKQVNAEAYNKKNIDKVRSIIEQMANTEDPAQYKSITERTGTEGRFNVSESGQAIVRESGETFDFANAEVATVGEGQMTFKNADGTEVYAGDIDFADDNQSFLVSAVSEIENITPAAASAVMHDIVDTAKPIGMQINGIDEAYTYGFHGYSVEDMKSGNFTQNLTEEQMMSAYRLGQSARKTSDVEADAPVVKMRTAKQAALSKKEMVAQQKTQIESDNVEVYFQDGGTVVKFDEHTGQYDDKRMAAVNTAKFLSKLGIGGKYYFYESYENATGDRVYKDSDGNEVEAPNGIYKEADGSIHIDLNAGDAGQGTALFTMSHELGHFVKAQSKKQFKILGDLVTEAFSKTDMSMHERVVAKQDFLSQKRGHHVSYDEAYEEVVCDALSTMLSDGSFHEKIMEIKVKDKGLFNTIKKFFENLIAKFKKVYEGLTPDQKDAQDIREMKDMFDRIQTAFAEALVEASDNFHASETVLAQAGISVDANTDAGSIFSVRDVLNETERNKVANALAERFGVTLQEAKEWLKAETSLASLILNPKYSMYLDYEGDPNEVAIKQNSDYPQGTVDFSNICKKRREFTQVMNRVLRNFPNPVFAATDLAKIRTIMGEEGMTLPCGICYVEDRRQLDTIVAQDFINGLKLYREGSKTRPDGKPFNANQLKGLQLTDGDTYVPTIYELVSLEGRNSLKEKNPNMEAAWVRYNNARGMQAVRLLTNEAEYKRQILKYNKKTVQSKNYHGGLRIYSFSDAEMFHLIDIIQVITDSATVGLSLQGYTKVNEYAKAVKDTGEKLNRSLIPKGDLGYHMENGKVVLDYDTVEGIDINHKDFFDNKDNPNIGNITIGINDVQIRASMVSDFVDQIIPFHTGQSEEVLGEKGIAAWENYKDSQTEKDLATGRTSSHQVNIYTEVFRAAEEEGNPIQNKRQFVEKFLQVCKENGLQPRFAQFLNTDANGDYIYTEGYHKFLVDFKTFAQTEIGEYLPQMPVKPIFDDSYITGLLEAYVKEQQAKDAEVAKQMPRVIERITNEIVKPGVEKRSDRRTQKTFEKNQNANGVFVANVLIDLADMNSKWWTGTYNHVIFSMSKTDDTEFTQFHFEIEKRTKDMDDYEVSKQPTIEDSFTVQDGNGKEYIYVVKLDGYMHGVVLEKIDKAKYTAVFLNQTKGGQNGKSVANIKGRIRNARNGIGQNHSSSGRNRASAGNSGHGGLGSGSSQSSMAGIDEGKSATDRNVYAVTDSQADKKLRLEELSARAKWLREQLKRDRVSKEKKTEYRRELSEIRKEMGVLMNGYYPNKTKNSDRNNAPTFYSNLEDAEVEDIYSYAERGELENFKGEYNTSLEEFMFLTMKNELAKKNKRKAYEQKLKDVSYASTYSSDVMKAISDFRDAWQEFSGDDVTELYSIKGDLYENFDRIFMSRTFPLFASRYNKNADKKLVEGTDEYKKLGKLYDHARHRTEAFYSGLTMDQKREAYWHGVNGREGKNKISYSERGEGASNRHLLANAFEMAVQNSIEYEMLQDYRNHINELNELEAKLHQLNAEIRKIRFGTEGVRDADRLTELEDEAKKVAKEINRYDKRLLNMEASEPLRKVVDRERKKEAQKTKDRVKEIQQNKKARAEQTELRHKIRKTIRDLDKIYNRGNKKQNVKEGMKDFVAQALASAEVLFMDSYSNEDMVRNGVEVQVDAKENRLLDETQRLLRQRDDLYSIGSVRGEVDDVIVGDTSGFEKRMAESKNLDKQIAKNMALLRSVFERERARINETTVSSMLDDLAKAYKQLGTSEDLYIRNVTDENVYQHLLSLSDRMNGAIVKDMNVSQLEELYKAYKMVLHTVRNANNLFVKGKMESIDKMVEKITWDFCSRKIPNKTMAIIARNLENKIGWNYEKLYYALERIGSEAFTELVMNIANSENIVMLDVMEAAAFRDEMVEKYGFNNWDVNKEIKREFLDNTGKKFKLTLGELMSLYAYSRREGAWDHIEYGGFVFGEAALTNPKPADSYKLSKAQCEAITSLLTAEQKGYVEDMQKFLSETMGEKGNEVSMLLYGIKMFEEKNYFPIHIAGQFKAQAQESQAKAAAGFQTMSNAGFTHAQNPNAKAPFVLEGFNEVWVDHVNEMSRYHGTVPALEDMRRVMNRSSYSESSADSMAIKQLMENSYGKEAVKYFDNLYREANSGATVDNLQNLPKKLLSMFRKNSVAYSLSVLIQQPASITRAYALIDKKYFGFKGVGTITSGVAKAVSSKWNKAYTNAYNEMLKYAPGVTMAKEIGGFDTATGGSIRSYLLDTNKSFVQKVKTGTLTEKGKAVMDLVDDNAIANLPNVADKIAWIEIWNACKRESVAKHKDLKPGSEEFLKAVGERFTEVIRATQVYDSMFAKSPMLKSKNLAVQYMVSFMNEPNTTANMAESAVRDFLRGDRKNGVRKAAVLIHGIIFTGVLKSLVYAMRDDDEDETYIEKYLEALIGGLIDDFNALNYIPLARDVVSLRNGYDVERADMAIVADLLDAFDQVKKHSTTDTTDMTEKQLIELDKKLTESQWRLAESLAAFVGIPMKNIRREIKAVVNTATATASKFGKTTKKSVLDKVLDSFTQSEKSKKDKLYEAIIGGDTQYVDRIKSGYKTDESYHSAIREALRKNDSRIKEAAVAWNANDLDEYMRIAKEIIGEKHFVQDDVVLAIRAEANKIAPDDGKTSTSTSKANGLFTMDKFAEAIVQGDLATANAIKSDIIQTSKMNGKTVVEAEKSFKSSARTNIKESFLEGSLTESKVINALTSYCGDTSEEAEKCVGEWAFQKKYGYTYDEKDDAYKNGDISANELQSVLVNVGGKTEEEAMWQVEVYEWEAQGYDSVTPEAVRDYNKYCAAYDVPRDAYIHIWKFDNKTKNDVDEETGKTIDFSAMKKVMAEIGKLPLTPDQMYAIARSLGWKDKNIRKYKTW